MYKLEINIEEVSKYLGYQNQEVDEETLADIRKAEKMLQKEVQYKAIHRVFQIEKKEDGIKVVGTNMTLVGNGMKDLLRECDQCILMAVTLGQGVDQLLRKAQVTNLTQGVILDFCASSMVEQICNQFEDEIKVDWTEKGKFFTDRFSPGYGDLPITIQKTFCDVLDTQRKMGLTVTNSGIMIPRKSITAVIGISDKKQKMKIKGCKYCDFFKNCQYRKDGKTCG